MLFRNGLSLEEVQNSRLLRRVCRGPRNVMTPVVNHSDGVNKSSGQALRQLLKASVWTAGYQCAEGVMEVVRDGDRRRVVGKEAGRNRVGRGKW